MLPYMGGKNARTIKGKWVADTIGRTPDGWCYMEPFAGMLGVLLQRPKAKIEIANDLDGFVVSFWQAIRNYPDDFLHLIRHTPHSRKEYARAHDYISSGGGEGLLEDAHAAYVMIAQSMLHSTGAHARNFRLSYVARSSALSATRYADPENEPEYRAICDRLRHVALECRPAADILERVSEVGKIHIYCDPPYENAENPYRTCAFDFDAFMERLEAQNGMVAVSGYGDTYDRLGWVRRELDVLYKDSRGNLSDRTEVLWMNYEPPEAPRLI